MILWELWRFITPGLHRNEKRYAVPFIVSSIVLFAFGAFLAFVTFPHALQFLQNIGGPTLEQIYDPNKYLGLIVALMVVFGLTFEFPVILVSLELVGVLSPRQLSSWRRWAIVLIVVFAAVITPERRPVLHDGAGGAAVRLLRGVDRDRQVPAPLTVAPGDEGPGRR